MSRPASRRLFVPAPHRAAVLLVLVLPSSGLAWQGGRDRTITITDPNQVDRDYAYQGEYVGYVSGRGRIGLQVVAQGEGEFIATCYDGGLPGAGWNHSSPSKSTGSLSGDLVSLYGEDLKFQVRPRAAYVYSRRNHCAGCLNKVHRRGPTMGLRPPPDAVVLFDGSDTGQLDRPKITDDGLLVSGVTTKKGVGDFRLHLEFRLPYMPGARGQGRANSGVYVQRRYEIQVLDSFGLDGAANECGALYRQQPPDLNMCLPPLVWQTYDIEFRAPRWDESGRNKQGNAVVTVFQNGVAVHYRREIVGKTGAGRPEGPEPLPIYFQDHGNPVMFRNVWIVEGDPYRPRARTFARTPVGYRR